MSAPFGREPDKAAAARFLHTLDPEAKVPTFLALSDRKLPSQPPIEIHGSLDAAWPRLFRASADGCGVFATINETDLRGRKAENIVRVRALYADGDGAPAEHFLRLGLRPSAIVITSPDRWHAYWCVDGVSLEEFAGLQKRLIRLMGTDPAIHDLPRVMRLPGFPHQKGAPFMVQAHYPKERICYTHARIRRAIEEAEAKHGIKPSRMASLRTSVDPGAGLRAWTFDEGKRLHEVLQLIDPTSYEIWLQVGAAIFNAGWSEHGFAIWRDWSRRSPKYDEADQVKTWNSFAGYSGRPKTLGSIYHMAQQIVANRPPPSPEGRLTTFRAALAGSR